MESPHLGAGDYPLFSFALLFSTSGKPRVHLLPSVKIAYTLLPTFPRNATGSVASEWGSTRWRWRVKLGNERGRNVGQLHPWFSPSDHHIKLLDLTSWPCFCNMCGMSLWELSSATVWGMSYFLRSLPFLCLCSAGGEPLLLCRVARVCALAVGMNPRHDHECHTFNGNKVFAWSYQETCAISSTWETSS